MRKKRLAIILLSILAATGCAIGLAACGGGSSGGNEQGGNTGNEQGGNTGDEEQGGSTGDEENPTHTHTLAHTDAKDATCTESGNIAYWYCSGCGKYFSDSAGTVEITQAQTVVAALGHDYDYENAVAAWSGTEATVTVTCTRNGCTNETQGHSITIPDVTVTAETTATCTTDGETTYTAKFTVDGTEYTCTATHTEVIEAPGHEWNDGVCTACGAKEPSEGLAYTLSKDETYYTVSGIGACTDTDLVIADEHEGLPVTGIDSRAFNSCTSLTSITIPDSVTSIGWAAFLYCTSLTSVKLENGQQQKIFKAAIQ